MFIKEKQVHEAKIQLSTFATLSGLKKRSAKFLRVTIGHVIIRKT